MTTAIATIPLETAELAALPPSKAEQVRAVFLPMADMLAGFEDQYNTVMAEAADEVTPEVSARARRLRLDIAKVRIDAEKARVAVKAEYLLASKAIDGVNNVLKWAVSEKERALESIEKHAERLAAEARAVLQAERVELLAPYAEDAAERDLASMDADVWAAYLGAKKQAHEDRIRAEAEAEAARVAEAERVRAEQEAIRAERDRLAKEAEEKEAARRAELAKIEAARQAELDAIEAERKKEREAAEAERTRLAALEAAEKARLAKEAEEARKRAAAEKEAARAPVRKRLIGWVDSFALPELPGEDHEVAERVRAKFIAFQKWATAEIEGAL